MVSEKKIAILFPGQGSQYPGMGKSFFERYEQTKKLFSEAEEILEAPISKKIFYGTQEYLKQTIVTQPAIFLVSAAIFQNFSEKFPKLFSRCAYFAGHSLGEYSAFFSARAFDFQTALKLVKYRAEILQSACARTAGTMAAVIGMDPNQCSVLCKEAVLGTSELCEMVNFNSPSQIVVAGTLNGVKRLIEKISAENGAKAIPLSVSGAFHSSLMREAAEQMKEVLKSAVISDPRIPVITNCDGEITDASEQIREKLFLQIDHAVQWTKTIQAMIANGVDTFIEIGPGKVLSGLVKKIDRKKRVLNIEDADGLEVTIQMLSTEGL